MKGRGLDKGWRQGGNTRCRLLFAVFVLPFCMPFWMTHLSSSSFPFSLTPLFLSDAPKNEGDGGGRETEREDRRGRRTAGQSVGVWQAAHTQCMCLASHTQREDKTRHGNGDTHMGMDDMTHTQGEREGRRQGVGQGKTHKRFSSLK